MNWITLVAGVLMTGASVLDYSRGNPKMATIYGCYAVANFILSTMKG